MAIICTRCTLYKTTSRIKIDSVVGEIPVSEYKEPIEMAFLAEAPGKVEEEKGIPLVGPAGMNLNTALKSAGIDRAKVMLGNVNRCKPPDNRTPTRAEQQKCYPYLLKELMKVKPKVIVTLGLAATKTILQNSSIRMGDAHGRAYSGRPVLGFDCIIVPTWHPSPTTFINNEDRRFQMIADIHIAKKYLEGESLSDKKDWLSITVANYETWRLVLPILERAEDLTIDVETTGLDIFAKNAEITNIGITSYDNYGISVVCREGDWVRTDAEGNVHDYFKDFLADLERLVNEIPTIAHNMSFDAKYMKKKWNIWPKKWLWDTMLGHSLIRPGSSTKLKDISWLYTPKMGGYEHELSKVGGLLKANAFERVDYNVNDIVCTKRVSKKQRNILEKEKRLFLMQQIVMPASEIFAEMEYIGVPVDVHTLKELEKTYRKHLLDKKTKIYMHGTVMQYNRTHGSFNPNSTDQVGEILFDKKYCGFTPIDKSEKTEKASCSKKVLSELQRLYNSDLVDMILDYRTVLKLHSTYLKGMIPKLIDGRVHTTYHQDVARSGRTTSSSPNLQNISGNSDIKSIFIPDPGFKFIDLDYRQMELVVSAYYTGDEVMKEAILSGDAHTYIAKLIFGMKEVTEDNRRFIKTLNFGVLYGMGAGKLADSLSISMDEARHYISEYFDILKATKVWIDGRRRQAEERGFVTSKFGRIRYYKKKGEELPGEKIEYNSAVNHPIQSLASDIMLYAMVQWKKYLVERGLYLQDAYMALQVHDSITSCVRENLVEELVLAKKTVFESIKFNFMTLPLSVELKTGHNWGNLVKL